MEKSQNSWMCLEGNPKVFTDFAARLGFPTLLYRFHDVYTLDGDIWSSSLPEPVIAVILLYSIKEKHQDIIAQEVWEQKHDLSQNSPFFIKQNIANACGVISLLHAICNILLIELFIGNTVERCGGAIEGSYLEKYIKLHEKSSPEERGAYLNVNELNPEESSQPSNLHQYNQEFGNQGVPPSPDSTQQPGHFVCYIEKDGYIWELDGRMNGPMNKGRISPDQSLGVEVSKIIQKYIDIDPQETRYSVMALAPNYFDDL
ncbi:ubiquitin carboxyl-terminal hydrolase isozyme l3-like [Stylonychia lemnae]|uniref:Ubiquitin carboxyl-terminal hydrolase n=1 Tax=Stylonychia lemnae TaxID=5949 RepID=A0A078A7E1_STYLE|nr:ubiquitin carboxyl-terminal hydrolase isozyme l3-like [Stylonychia lemnae]|eukprot:CDW77791.1 ubiquitin carboxyl-terminal hydrolase isozyme l3-like [Stylonychia lemnae]